MLISMGAWGYKPLENDAALDELELLMEKSGLPEHVRRSLQQDLHECSDEIRATAYLVYLLAKNELWQNDSLREIVPVAISSLSRMLDEEIYSNVNFVGEIIHLRNLLRAVEPKPPRDLDLPQCEP